MSVFDQLKWSVGHDVCRAGDRVPAGAVPAGTGVRLTLRIDQPVRHLVRAVDVMVGERSDGGVDTTWHRVSLHASDAGFAGTVMLAPRPHASFYVFVLYAAPEYGWISGPSGAELYDSGHGQTFYYVPRADGRSTGGELVRPGEDGSWTGYGWSYSWEHLGNRPSGDLGLPALQPGFQVTTYESGFESPEWAQGPVMYQVFPDRFARGDAESLWRGIEYHKRVGRPYRFHDDWDDAVDWTGDVPDAGAGAKRGSTDGARGGKKRRGKASAVPSQAADSLSKKQLQAAMSAYDPVDFFGGSLTGIIKAIPYLASLGVEVLYLNPVFEARSNHRYDTADYERIDPILGSKADFKRLIAEAKKAGISIILDAVLSHTGFDSRYFNGAGTYDEPGALQGPESPFYDWFNFFDQDGKVAYQCWWGDPTLPEVDERNESWRRYILGEGRDGGKSAKGVLPKWLSEGVRGYRLDVADEIPDDVLEGVRMSVKRAKPDGLIIGEVWEDPTTKTSYGSHRSFGLGKSLDSVMNYPLRGALIGFALGFIDAHQLASVCKLQQSNYPQPLYRCLMNLISSHDVERLRTMLATGGALKHLPRNEQLQAMRAITVEQDEQGAKLQRLIVGLLFALPGMPCIYYGDEKGMQGGGDPFCRATFPWDERARQQRFDCGLDLTAFYQGLGTTRKESDVLRRGEFACLCAGSDVLCVARVLAGGEAVFAVTNRSERPTLCAFDFDSPHSMLSAGAKRAISGKGPCEVLFDCSEAQSAQGVEGPGAPQLDHGIFRVNAPAASTVFYRWGASR